MNSASHHVLLVEDYEPNVVVAGYFLEDFGCTYDVAHNGMDALEKAHKTRYIAILMDVQMPVMDGYTATAHIRKFEQEHNLPRAAIIGMTANALVGDREKCIESGMDDYISKPFSPDDLKKKLYTYLSAKE
ncbi:MAG: hypothetical protein DI626_08475 [Micavibrio aeruginosavorus]|uniref:Response regulatory domain-containing protein n=1 Tax=Micavibrio aeruginosavorus TaxID=349221 RepID=A0A2W4ZVB5_9BACT|nr:MAG: hypothetical protein DI626_08475 [Micavibrio aeruginosavorus]